MQIGYLVPGTGMTLPEQERRRSLLQKIMGNNFKALVLTVDEGPASIESAEDEIAAVAPTLKRAGEVENELDALIIGCSGDIGIEHLRKALTIPVIGPARVSYTMAAAVFQNVGILSLNQGFIEEEKALAAQFNIIDRISDIRALDYPVEFIIKFPEKTAKHIKEVIGVMKANAVVLGCMSMAFLCEEIGLTSVRGTRVINPLRVSVAAAISMIV